MISLVKYLMYAKQVHSIYLSEINRRLHSFTSESMLSNLWACLTFIKRRNILLTDKFSYLSSNVIQHAGFVLFITLYNQIYSFFFVEFNFLFPLIWSKSATIAKVSCENWSFQSKFLKQNKIYWNIPLFINRNMGSFEALNFSTLIYLWFFF